MPTLTEAEKNSFLGRAYSLKTQDQTNGHYADWSRTYDQDMETGGYCQPDRVAAAVLACGVEKNARILDVGCGTGLAGVALHKSGYHRIEGNDISAEMLEKAAATGVYTALESADLNVPPLQHPDGAFDAVTAVGVFSFAHVMPDAIDELLRLIRAGGALVIGLNAHFYAESDLKTKIDRLVTDAKVRVLDREHGGHMKSTGTGGWVISLQKCA